MNTDILHALTTYIRMSNKERAVECSIKIVMDSLKGYLAEDRSWASMSMNVRRAELFAVLRVAAQSFNSLADYLQHEAKKYSETARL